MSELRNGHLSEDMMIALAGGVLEPELRSGAIDHLRACGSCERSFEEICGDAERLRTRGRLEGRLELSARVTSEGATAAVRPRAARLAARGLTAMAVAAAVLLAVVLLLRLVGRPSAPTEIVYWYPLDPDSVAFRSGSASEFELFTKVAEAYRRRDTRHVLELLEGRKVISLHDLFKIVLASALSHEGRHDEALRVLDALEVETLPQPAKDRARWIRYLALREAGKTDLARRAAEQLGAAPGEFSAAARRELGQR